MISIIPGTPTEPIGCFTVGGQVRLAQLKINGGVSIQAMATVPIQGDADACVSNTERAICAALEQGDFQGNRIVLGAGAGMTRFRRMLMAPMPEQELAEAVQWQMASELSIDPDRSMIDYHDVGEIIESGKRRREVIGIAASNQDIQALLGPARAAGLEVTAIDTGIGAVSRCVTAMGEEDSCLCINLRTSAPMILVAQGGQPCFVREIAPRSLPLSVRAGAGNDSMPCMEEEMDLLIRSLASEINRCAYSLSESHGGAFFPKAGCVLHRGVCEDRMVGALSKLTEVRFIPVQEAAIGAIRPLLDDLPDGETASDWIGPIGLSMYGVEHAMAGAAA